MTITAIANCLVGIATLGYIGGSIMYLIAGDRAQAVMFLGAAIANLGAIWSTWK